MCHTAWICALGLILTWTGSIEKILNLNHASPEDGDAHHDPTTINGLTPKSTPILNADGEPVWKVLVFDNLGRDVISSVLRVSDLRGWGITIHLCVGFQSIISLLRGRGMLIPERQEHQFSASCHTRCTSTIPCRTDGREPRIDYPRSFQEPLLPCIHQLSVFGVSTPSRGLCCSNGGCRNL